jgi:beta-glucosidase
MKTFTRIVFVTGCLSTLLMGQWSIDPQIEAKIDELLAKMTFAEKVGQMTQLSGINERYEEMIRKGEIGSLLNVVGAKETNRVQKIAVTESRLGIPLIFGLDVIHGYRTIFPIPLASSASWDTALIRTTSAIAAKEAESEGIRWSFAPMVDIARDPRWGRIAEGAGEDPFLGSAISRAQVLGFQGKNLSDPLTLMACAKHYVAYGAAEGGRDYNTADLSERTLREIYLPPFEAAVRAGAGSVMSAFNEISGIPASANEFTLRDILKGEWNFNGLVVSDWNSIAEVIQHGIAADKVDAAAKSLIAGVDMDMQGDCYTPALEPLVTNGTLSIDLINDAVRRILRLKFMLGLFDHPYVDEELYKDIILNSEHIQTALELARESIVLLKNEKNILPLDRKKIKRIALIGPLADDQQALLGCWQCLGRKEDAVTIREGLKNRLGSDIVIDYVRGCEITNDDKVDFNKALQAARQADVVIMAMGERADMSGEGHSRSNLDLPGVQPELVTAVAESGKPVILVLINGRPLTLAEVEPKVAAIVESWQLGIQHGNAVADVLLGNYNPSGKLTASFPYTVGQIPVYYNHKNTGRPPAGGVESLNSKYIDCPPAPLYPFGYGLSYTTFKYSNLNLSSNPIPADGELLISVRVQNAGKRDGVEVVQLYLRDPVASVTQPVKELKGFQRIALKAGETKTVEFKLTQEHFSFIGMDNKRIVEPGEFQVTIKDLQESFWIK